MFGSTGGLKSGRWVALALFFWVQGTVAAEKQEEWLYSFQPGDNLWNLTERFLIDLGYWSKLVKLNRIQHPRQMPPGTLVRIPLDWLKVEPAAIQVIDVRGQAVHLIAGKKEQPLVRKVWLHSGDRLRVGKNASVLLKFSDGTRQLLGSNTEIELVRVNRFPGTGIGDTTVKILHGETENKVPARGTRFEIRTPSANTTVRGTLFRVKIPASQHPASQVEVVAGVVQVQGDQGRLTLSTGFGTLVKKGSAPAPAVKLLPAPRIAAPPPVIRRLPLELRWSPVEGAKAYRILVGEPGEDSASVLRSLVTHHRFSTSSLPDGRYQVRVRAIDAAGLEGKESNIAFLLDARPLPPVPVAPPADSTVRTEAVDFEWSTPPQASHYRFQLSVDEHFQTLVVDNKGLKKTSLALGSLAPGTWFWRVASFAAAEQGPWGMPQQFVLKPAPAAPAVETVTHDDSLQLHWQKIGAGQKYRLQLAEDQSFTNLLTDVVLDEPRWSMHRPQSPVHFRIRTIDDDGYAGAWSPAHIIYPKSEPWYLFGIPAIAIILLAL